MKAKRNIAASTETGTLGVMHLKRLWSRFDAAWVHGAKLPSQAEKQARLKEWILDRIVVHGLGLPLEQTWRYFGTRRNSFEAFEEWVLAINNGHIDPLQIRRINSFVAKQPYDAEIQAWLDGIERSDPVLSPDDLAFWEENGYVVVRGAVSKEDCRAAEHAVWEFLNMDPANPDTWYDRPIGYGTMVQLYRHPALDANRRSPRIHKVFSQLWGTADLWTTIDRVSFNPPERFDFVFPGPKLNWDASLAPPIRFNVHGLLYLTDTAADQGAFTCVPGFHKRVEQWLETLPPHVDPRRESLAALGAVPVPGEAGDLIISHAALPHGLRPNTATLPLIAQFVDLYWSGMQHNPNWR